MTFPILVGALLLAAQAAAQAPAPPPPEQFFVGRLEAAGTVHVILTGRHGVRDRMRGRLERPGVLLIDDVVEEEGKPPRRRAWRLVRTGNRIVGTVSDARGPVTGEIVGSVFHLRYRLADGPSVEQWITLHPNGRTASNRMVVRRFGIVVARVETILRRVD